MSTGRVSINIDNKIRQYYVDTLRRHEEDDTRIDPETLFFVLGWALHYSVRTPGRNPSLEASVDQSSCPTRNSYLFFVNHIRSVDDRVHPITDYHAKMFAEIKTLLQHEPGTDEPLMLSHPYYMRFTALFFFSDKC